MSGKLNKEDCVLFSGAAQGAEAAFGAAAERHGVEEVNFTFDGHSDARSRGIRVLTTAELKRGLSGLATIGSTAPFVGLFGTVFGIINAFVGMGESASAGISAVAGGIAEALVTTAVGLAVAVPAVWLFNYFTSKVDNFVVEMDNSSAELIDFFLKQRGKK